MKKYTIAAIVFCTGFALLVHWMNSPEVRKVEMNRQIQAMTSELQLSERGDFIQFSDGHVDIILYRIGSRIVHQGLIDGPTDDTAEGLAPKIVNVIQRKHVDAWRSAAAMYASAIFRTNNVTK